MESAAGFRFYPTEEELISFYLHHKLEGPRPELDRVIPRVDIYAFEPWLLPSMAGERCKDDREQWFFFMPQQEREARGGRPNRTTGSGYWKATGSPGYVYSSQHRVIGLKKTMVFYKGKAPSGKKTKWKLNEYKAIKLGDHPSSSIATPKLRHEMSVCRVYVSSGSARVFDRRPSGTVATINTITRTTPSYQQARIPGGDINEADTTSLHKTPAMAVEFEKSSCSTVSSNSGGDHGHGSMPEDISFYGDLQTLGNWDHLNWP